MRRLWSIVGAELIYRAALLLMKANDRRMVRLLSGVERLAGFFGAGEDATQPVKEMREVFEMGKPYSEVMRRFVTDARPSQIRAVLRGMLSD